MNPRGTGWPIPRFASVPFVWRPATECHQIVVPNGSSFAATVVRAHAVQSLGPLATMTTGVSFRVETTVSGRAATVPLTIFDQGRALLGKKDGLGRGVRLSNVKEGCTGQAEMLPANTRLLTFIIVAKAPLCDDDQLAALYALLRSLGVGSSFLALANGQTMLVYDTERSTAHLPNNALFDIASLMPGLGFKPTNNLRMIVPSAPDIFTAAWATTKSLAPGAHLFGAYGSHSPLNRAIRVAQAELKEKNARLSPKVNAKRAHMIATLAEARAAKKAKWA